MLLEGLKQGTFQCALHAHLLLVAANGCLRTPCTPLSYGSPGYACRMPHVTLTIKMSPPPLLRRHARWACWPQRAVLLQHPHYPGRRGRPYEAAAGSQATAGRLLGRAPPEGRPQCHQQQLFFHTYVNNYVKAFGDRLAYVREVGLAWLPVVFKRSMLDW